MKDDKQYWLNEHGLRIWMNKHEKTLTAQRAYHWKDYVIIIDESDEREIVGFSTFEEFMELEENWNPMTKKQYEVLINQLKEKHNK